MKIEGLPDKINVEELHVTFRPGTNIPEELTVLWHWIMKNSKGGLKVVATGLNGVTVTFDVE